MKKLRKAAGTAVFLAIAVVLLAAASYLVRPGKDVIEMSRFRGFYAEPEESIDVIFTGSSAMYRFINPLQLWEEYGFTSYSMTSPSQPIAVTKYVMDEVEKTQSPQLYVVECRRLFEKKTTPNAKSIRWTTDAMKYSLNRFQAVRELTAEKKKNKLSYYLDIIKYHDNWEQVNKESVEICINGLKLNGKGWYERTDWKEGLSEPELVAEDEKLAITEYYEGLLRELIAKCKSEGKEVLFVLSPYQMPEKAQKMANYVRDIVEESGYQFLDCNRYYDEIGIDFSTDYYDWKHANSIGAEKTTRFIGKYITEHYELETEYDDAVSAEWNEAALAAREEHEEAKEIILTEAGVND